jgi:hypothetical protein
VRCMPRACTCADNAAHGRPPIPCNRPPNAPTTQAQQPLRRRVAAAARHHGAPGARPAVRPLDAQHAAAARRRGRSVEGGGGGGARVCRPAAAALPGARRPLVAGAREGSSAMCGSSARACAHTRTRATLLQWLGAACGPRMAPVCMPTGAPAAPCAVCLHVLIRRTTRKGCIP